MSADPSGAGLLKALLDAGLVGPFVTYADVAACAMIVYDYMLTFRMEVDLVWKSKWNVVKILFLFQRYMPFADVCYLSVYRQLAFNLSDVDCTWLMHTTGFMFITGFLASEALLSIRVFALWNRDIRLAIFLPILFVAVFAPAYYAMYLYVHSIQVAIPPFPGFHGCFVVGASEAVIWTWALLMVWNTITLALIMIPGIKSRYAGTNSTLANIIYRDGAFYYIYLFIFSSLNIVLSLTLVPAKRPLIASLERGLHSILASRVILHMREQARAQPECYEDDMEFSSTSAVRTAQSIPGVLSRRLDTSESGRVDGLQKTNTLLSTPFLH